MTEKGIKQDITMIKQRIEKGEKKIKEVAKQQMQDAEIKKVKQYSVEMLDPPPNNFGNYLNKTTANNKRIGVL